VRGHTSIEIGERRLIFGVALLEQDLERVLTAALLQVLEAEFRRIGLFFDRDANEPLRVMRQPVQLMGGTGLMLGAERHALRTVAQCPCAGE